MKAIGLHLGGPAIEGSGDLSIDLAGEGATAAEIVSSLSGNLALEMREGARLGISVDALAALFGCRPAFSRLGQRHGKLDRRRYAGRAL